MKPTDRRPPMTTAPCPRCLKLAIDGQIRPETVMPLPQGAFAPMGHNGQKCCFDCQGADNLTRVLGDMSFASKRIAVGNDRQECLRLPAGIRLADAMGLIKEGIVKNWPNKDDFEAHLKWLDVLARVTLAAARRAKGQKVTSCRGCKAVGHNKRTCPMKNDPEGSRMMVETHLPDEGLQRTRTDVVTSLVETVIVAACRQFIASWPKACDCTRCGAAFAVVESWGTR